MHFSKDRCVLRYDFYHDFLFWSTGPSFVIKGSNTNELNLFHFMLCIIEIKISLFPTCIQHLPLLYFLAHLIAIVKPCSRHWTERQSSLLEKCHLMVLVVQVMCHLWRAQSFDSCFWVISVYLKQLVLSLRHLSTWADDVLTGTLSPVTSNQEALRSCESCNCQLKEVLGHQKQKYIDSELVLFKKNSFKCVTIVLIDTVIFFILPFLHICRDDWETWSC